MKSRSRTSADRAAVANHFAIAQHAAFGIIFIPDTVGSAAQAETAVGGEEGGPGSDQNSDITRVGEFELDLNAFEDERSVGWERNGSELGLGPNALQDRPVACRSADGQRFCPDRNGVSDKRPVAPDFDGVAVVVAGALHCLGERVELALGDALAAQDHEGLCLRLDGGKALLLPAILQPLPILPRLLPALPPRTAPPHVHLGPDVLTLLAGAVAGAVRAEAEVLGGEFLGRRGHPGP